MRTEHFKNYISILAIINNQNWLDALLLLKGIIKNIRFAFMMIWAVVSHNRVSNKD